MARLEHRNVVKVYGAGTDGGRLFVAMELVDGVTLDAWLRDRRSRAEIVDMFVQAGEGLAAVHRAGLVHRDFKPQNVLVDREGRPRVADFGIAHIDTAPPLTGTGAIMGTPGYMAPEQLFGRDVDARADQYSFCVALHAALVDASAWADAPPAIRAVITRGLAHESTERFDTMDELLVALRSRAAGSRRPVVIALAAVAVAGIATVGVLGIRERSASIAGDTSTSPSTSPSTTRDASVVALAPAMPDAEIAIDAATHPRLSAIQTARADAGTAITLLPPPPFVSTHLDAGSAPIEPPLHDVSAADLADMRSVIAPLGYSQVTLSGNDADSVTELEARLAKIAADDEGARGMALFALGAVERHRGHCSVAIKRFRAAIEQFDAALHRTPGTADRRWATVGQVNLGIGMCLLAAGNASAALQSFYDAKPILRRATRPPPRRASRKGSCCRPRARRVTSGSADFSSRSIRAATWCAPRSLAGRRVTRRSRPARRDADCRRTCASRRASDPRH